MTTSAKIAAPVVAERPDYRRLPEPVEASQLVESSADETPPFEPVPIWAAPEIAGMVPTRALGG